MAILEPAGLTTTASWDFEDCWLSQDQREAAVCKGPDLLLDVPVLKVDELDLHVEGLKARVYVTAEMADLVRLSTGADVNLGKVDLTAKDVDVQALMNARLDEVRAILVKALTTVSENPKGLGVERTAVDSAAEVSGEARAAVGQAATAAR